MERKRRTNINEGIDLLVAQIGIPDLEKQGKGVQLRRAVEHVQELDERIMGYEKEVHDLRKEKEDLEVSHLSSHHAIFALHTYPHLLPTMNRKEEVRNLVLRYVGKSRINIPTVHRGERTLYAVRDDVARCAG